VTVDLYAALGVSRAATGAELRRAYRRLALEHHPDRAGPASAPRFARIAEAYRLLSNPTARAVYDAHLFERETWPPAAPGGGTAATSEADQSDDVEWRVSSIGWSASWAKRIPDLLPRLTGSLDHLVASRAAWVEPDATLELRLTATEAQTGGTAIVTMPLRILCPTCGGVARPGGVWCRRCEFAGHVTNPVPVRIPIPRAVPDGFLVAAIVARSTTAPPRIRIRVAR
jgi:molecular chaperone DnaJ